MRCLIGKETSVAQAAIPELSGTVETVNDYKRKTQPHATADF